MFPVIASVYGATLFTIALKVAVFTAFSRVTATQSTVAYGTGGITRPFKIVVKELAPITEDLKGKI